jgi:hypothetical protein
LWQMRPKLSTSFEEIISHGHGNFKMQNKVLESSIIIINYGLIIINAYYNYIINAYYNYYVSNKDLLEECGKEENVAVKRFIQSTLPIAPDLCKNVSLALLFGRNGNSYTVCTQSSMCMCAHVRHNIQTLVG